MKNRVWGWGVCCIFLLYTHIALPAQTTHRIPSEFPTLQAAVNQAQNGDTLFIESGIYTDSTSIVGKTLVIIGDSNNRPELQPTNYGIGLRLFNAHVECWNLAFSELPFKTTPPPHTAIECENSTLAVYQCSFRAVYQPIYAFKSDIVVSHSEFHDIAGWAAVVLNIGSYSIHNNLIYSVEWQGISCSRSNGAIFNNTIIGSTDTAHFGLLLNPDDTIHVFNNIINNFGIGINLVAADTFQLRSALQVYHNSIEQVAAPYRYEYNERLDWPIFKGVFTPKPGTGEQHSTPLFLNPANHNYAVAATSPCIDNGHPVFPVEVQRDFAGNPRRVGAAPDIGAFEHQALSSVATPQLAESTALLIYPSPVHTQLFVHLPTAATGTASLLDAMGRVVQHSSFANQQFLSLDINAASGIYLLVVTTEKAVLSQTFIKQ